MSTLLTAVGLHTYSKHGNTTIIHVNVMVETTNKTRI